LAQADAAKQRFSRFFREFPEFRGEVHIAGQRLSGPSRKIGVVFQAPVLLPWRTVLQNILVPIESKDGMNENRNARPALISDGRVIGFRKQIPH